MEKKNEVACFLQFAICGFSSQEETSLIINHQQNEHEHTI